MSQSGSVATMSLAEEVNEAFKTRTLVYEMNGVTQNYCDTCTRARQSKDKAIYRNAERYQEEKVEQKLNLIILVVMILLLLRAARPQVLKETECTQEFSLRYPDELFPGLSSSNVSSVKPRASVNQTRERQKRMNHEGRSAGKSAPERIKQKLPSRSSSSDLVQAQLNLELRMEKETKEEKVNNEKEITAKIKAFEITEAAFMIKDDVNSVVNVVEERHEPLTREFGGTVPKNHQRPPLTPLPSMLASKNRRWEQSDS